MDSDPKQLPATSVVIPNKPNRHSRRARSKMLKKMGISPTAAKGAVFKHFVGGKEV